MSTITYPSTIKSNKERLWYVVYPVLEQIRLERNRQWERAKNEPSKYMDTGIFHKYELWARNLSHPLHLEQINLRKAIRDSQMSLAEWKKLDNRQRLTFHLQYHGDKLAIRGAPVPEGVKTLALPKLLLKKLDDFSPLLLTDPLENWATAYTEVDTPGHLTVDANHITIVDMQRGDDCCVWKDHGVNHFGALFTHEFVTRQTDASVAGDDELYSWAVAKDTNAPTTSSDPIIFIFASYDGSTTDYFLRTNDGATQDDDYYTNRTLGTYWYVIADRNASTMDAEFYASDAGLAKGALQDTMTMNKGTSLMRYLCTAFPRDGSAGSTSEDGDVWNMDLNEAAPAAGIGAFTKRLNLFGYNDYGARLG